MKKFGWRTSKMQDKENSDLYLGIVLVSRLKRDIP